MKKVLFISLLVLSNISYSQSREGMELCFALQSNSVMSDIDAEDALERILDVIGASKNFALVPCDKISNAVATAYKGTRYILYDKKFMSLINQNTNDWSSLFILAHEVGHHINGHSLDILLYASDVVDAPTLEKKRKQELEADEFAAFVLAKLGASLAQLNNVITLIADNDDDTFSTHPNRTKRLQSVKEGFNRGFEIKKTKVVLVNSKMKEYEKSKSFTRYGQWYREVINDIFEGKKIKSITAGNIVGNQSKYAAIPNLIYEASESVKGKEVKISLDLGYKELFDGFSWRNTKNLNYIAIILDSKGNKIFEKEFSFNTTNHWTNIVLSTSDKRIFNSIPSDLTYRTGSNKLSNEIPLFYGKSKYSSTKKFIIPINELKKGNKLIIRFEQYSTGSEKDAFTLYEELLYDRYLKIKNNRLIYSSLNFSKIEFERWFSRINSDCFRDQSFTYSTDNFPAENYNCNNIPSIEKDLIKEIRGVINKIETYSYDYGYKSKVTDFRPVELYRLKDIAVSKIKEIETKNIDLTDSYLEFNLSGSSKALAD